MGMTYEEKKKVVEAAKVLKAFCPGKDCYKCFLINEDGVCVISKKNPSVWKIPKLSRWTPEDVALAKGLKGLSVKQIRKLKTGVFWEIEEGECGRLPNEAFYNLDLCEVIPIDSIISEAAEG